MVHHTEEEEQRLHCFEFSLGCKIVAFDLPEFHVCDGNLTETPSSLRSGHFGSEL